MSIDVYRFLLIIQRREIATICINIAIIVRYVMYLSFSNGLTHVGRRSLDLVIRKGDLTIPNEFISVLGSEHKPHRI